MATKSDIKLPGGCLDCGGDLYSVGLYPKVNPELILFMCQTCGCQHEMPLLDTEQVSEPSDNLNFPVEGF
ncbi:hypothetical protein CFI10_09375 [Marinobacterium iners]|uniref:hypothetical protein n=1 Tax=Marinobacterium iners TaxID=48076 RepID=UPI001A8FAA4D|nr:hypothetical protein [Marinobacterium iners]QSR35204.1 hypothetical protein CFI10_09375 [Marinobacterium iners]